MNIALIRERVLLINSIFIALLFIIHYTIGSKLGIEILLFVSLWNSITYAILLYKELTLSRDFHPFVLMFISAIQFVGFNGVYIYNKLASGQQIYFGIFDITDYIVIGTLFVSLEHILLYLGFHLAEKRNKNADSINERISNTNVDFAKLAYRFYYFVWGLRLINYVFPIGSVTVILSNIAGQGQLVTLMLLLFASLKTGAKKYLQIHWIITLIEISCVMSSGMKEDITRNLLPYIVFLFLQIKSGRQKFGTNTLVKFFILGMFVLYFVFPYVSLYRQMNWTERRNVSTSEVLDEYVKYAKGESQYSNEDEDRDIDYMMMRAGTIEQNTFPIMYAQTNGIVPHYLYYSLIAFIPRILWPNKPQLRLGMMIFQLSNGETNWEHVHSGYGIAYSIGFIGACYFSLGLWYALIMPFLMGYFMTVLWQFYKKRICTSFVAIWAVIEMMLVINKDFEAFSDGGIAFFVWNVLYVLSIKYLENSKHVAR